MTYLRKRIKAFGYALDGLSTFFKNEAHAKIHLLAATIAVIAGCYFKLTAIDWCWISLAITLVYISEIINSAIENIIDLVSPEKSDLAKNAKDLGAAAVLCAAIFALIIGVLVFQSYL